MGHLQKTGGGNREENSFQVGLVMLVTGEAPGRGVHTKAFALFFLGRAGSSNHQYSPLLKGLQWQQRASPHPLGLPTLLAPRSGYATNTLFFKIRQLIPILVLFEPHPSQMTE